MHVIFLSTLNFEYIEIYTNSKSPYGLLQLYKLSTVVILYMYVYSKYNLCVAIFICQPIFHRPVHRWREGDPGGGGGVCSGKRKGVLDAGIVRKWGS